MNQSEARYIIRMICSFRNGVLFLDATDQDSNEMDRIRSRYQEAGGWIKGSEAALSEFIVRVAETGIPGGEYINSKNNIDLFLSQREVPLIERPPRHCE